MACNHAKIHNSLLLIESTCNQVNHRGGYTNTKPNAFYKRVLNIAKTYNLQENNLLLGGDHLGPNPWTHLPSEKAMKEAKQMVHDYVKAGYKKIHLDASMSCIDDITPLNNEIISERIAQLCEVAEKNSRFNECREK